MRYSIVLLLCLVALDGCRKPSPPGVQETEAVQETRSPPPVGPKQETGNCRNELLEGTCKLMGVHEEESRLPEGRQLLEVWYSIETRDGESRQLQNLYHVEVPVDRTDDAEAFFEKKSPVECTAYIVRPPCNPQASHVAPDIELPDYIEKSRY